MTRSQRSRVSCQVSSPARPTAAAYSDSLAFTPAGCDSREPANPNWAREPHALHQCRVADDHAPPSPMPNTLVACRLTATGHSARAALGRPRAECRTRRRRRSRRAAGLDAAAGPMPSYRSARRRGPRRERRRRRALRASRRISAGSGAQYPGRTSTKCGTAAPPPSRRRRWRRRSRTASDSGYPAGRRWPAAASVSPGGRVRDERDLATRRHPNARPSRCWSSCASGP